MMYGARACYYCGVSFTDPDDYPPGLELSEDEWRAVLDRERTTDHRIPRSGGGSDLPENLVAACRRCNTRKGVLSEAEFRALLEVAGP